MKCTKDIKENIFNYLTIEKQEEILLECDNVDELVEMSDILAKELCIEFDSALVIGSKILKVSMFLIDILRYSDTLKKKFNIEVYLDKNYINIHKEEVLI